MLTRAENITRVVTRLALAALVAASFTAVAASADDGDHGLHRLHRLHEMMGSHKGGFLGVQLTELTPELRTHFGVPESVGVMISKVVPDSPAEKAGLRAGDIITRVDGEDVGSTHRLQRLVGGREDGGAAVLEIWRDGSMDSITAHLETRERFGPGRHIARFMADCEGDDCAKSRILELRGDGLIKLRGLGCGDAEDCDLQVKCQDGDCECTLNGEATECAGLHPMGLLHHPHEHGDDSDE